jgi:hypothetical protein
VCLSVSFVEWVRGADVGEGGELREQRVKRHKD